MQQLGMTPSPEARQRVQMMLEMAKAMQKHVSSLDSEITHTVRIEGVDRALRAKDVAFEVPAGTAFKASLLDGMFDGAPPSQR